MLGWCTACFGAGLLCSLLLSGCLVTVLLGTVLILLGMATCGRK